MELKNLTFAMIKPDAVTAHNTGKIIDIIEQNGFEIVRLQKVIFAQDLAEEFYASLKERPFYKELVDFIISGPVIALALYKENAVEAWRTLIGVTNPAEAAPGTIRHTFGKSIGQNAVHGSDSYDNALNELELIFSDLFQVDLDDLDSDENDSEEDDECCVEICDDSCNG